MHHNPLNGAVFIPREAELQRSSSAKHAGPTGGNKNIPPAPPKKQTHNIVSEP